MKADVADAKIFTDGSGTNNKIGAGAIIYRNGRPSTALRHQLGPIQHHTVYEGEAVGVLLALHITQGLRALRSVNIYTDNRAAITAASGIKPRPGHYIFDEIHEVAKALIAERGHTLIKLGWIPGHRNVEGNERADRLANEATSTGSSEPQHLPKLLKTKLPISKSAAEQHFLDKIRKRAQRDWLNSRRYSRMKATDPAAPSNSFLKLIEMIPRRQASVLTQLRTGHVPLAKHLHRINRCDSPICPACLSSSESVAHLIIHCSAFHNARQTLRRNTGGRSIDIAQILTTKKFLPALFNFLAETKRLLKNQSPSNNVTHAPIPHHAV